MNRKEGWYWVKSNVNRSWLPLYYDSERWVYYGDRMEDSFFHLIHENRILTPDEPSVLDRAIELIEQRKIKSRTSYRTGEYRVGLTHAQDILEQLKSEL